MQNLTYLQIREWREREFTVMFKFFKGLLLLSLCFSMTQAQCGTGCLTCEGAVCSDCLNKYYLSGGNCRMTSFMLNFDSPFKSDNCHESCLNCFGPDEDQCLDCLPPRKLHTTVITQFDFLFI